MKKIAFFDAKSYDKVWFNQLNQGRYAITFYESKLNAETAQLTQGYDAVCAFVNDTIDASTIETLASLGVKMLTLRCAGYSNVDIKAALGKIKVARVPAYSPHAVAEHAMALLLCLNRKIHRAHNRTRDFNFSISGLTGIDLHGKTVGVIGTGKIGRVFIDICRGFGMRVLAYDLFPAQGHGIEYVDMDTLLELSDVISLHCPLTPQTEYILNEAAFEKMKEGVFVINTSRGALIDTQALITALNNKKVRGAGLDVYEEEEGLFFEDFSGTLIKDDTLSLLLSRPNVLLTSHQAFLTEEALQNIASTTLCNLDEFFNGSPLTNGLCYNCESGRVEKEGKKTCC